MAPGYELVLRQVPSDRWVSTADVVVPEVFDTPGERVLRRLNREGFILRRMVDGVARWTRTPTGDRALAGVADGRS